MDQINKILEQKAVRITPMRQLLLEHFIKGNVILGLSELEKAFPKSDRITMYRTLKTFEENGILHSVKSEAEEIKYALCKEHCTPDNHFDQHPHFHCLKCEQVTCLESVLIPEMKLPNGYSKEEVNMIIKGTCPKCQN